MSLPTPPGTSHRDEKENRAPRFTRVSWSDTPELHPITGSPPRTTSARSSASKPGPSRSILKKTAYPILPPIDEGVAQKESTPEPEDPLVDLHYLGNPVARIIAPDTSLCALIQAYTSLMARLRNCVAGNTDADASWPLFQPIRKNRKAVVEALVRDLQQVFVDPLDGVASSSAFDPLSSPLREPPSTTSLPSPCDSPKKTRKRGMSEEQVKRARDLCGLCHAVMRLLGVIFTLPSLYNLFNEEELGYIFTQVLTIPLANELPTPNARKTCALAIWLIQVQRLPAEVLEPAKDRIAYALRRGIDGELGKEGKKGSASDGLKAVHDLALYQPAIFVPAFVPVLSGIIANLLAPTLVMRGQACHALGGLAYAAASLPPSEAHTRMATTVATFLAKSPDVSPTTPSKSKVDASPSKDSLLVRTLRTTLQAAEPKHSAQGPVWAFSVIAYLVVLLGPTVYLHQDLTRSVTAPFSLGMRHTKSSVRALGCLAWRSMTWAFFRAPHVKVTVDAETDGEDESATEDDVISERKKHDEMLRGNFKILPSIVDMGAGVSTVGALLGQDVVDDVLVFATLRVLRNMSKKGGTTCKDAMELTRHLLSVASLSHGSGRSEEIEWNPRKLLAPSFFSANPGLLTAEWKQLSAVVKPLIEECPQIADVRTLTLDEISAEGMWEEFLAIWKDGLSVLRLSWGSEEVPGEIREIWFNLLKCHAAPLLDSEDQCGLADLATNARDVLLDILDDATLDFTMRKEELGEGASASPVKRNDNVKGTDQPLPEHRWNYAVKLFLVRDLFTITRAVFPSDVFAELAEAVLRYLNSNEKYLVGNVQCSDEVREQWACMCAEAAFACDTNVVHSFWDNSLRKARRHSNWDADVRASVWQAFLDRWTVGDASGSCNWECAVVLLSAPFVEPSCWDMTTEDMDMWDAFLRRAIDAALDHGIDATTLVDQIAGVIATNHSPSAFSAVRVADLLLSNVEIGDARQVPTEVLEFANDTLNSAYPPAPRHKIMCMWFVRSLTRVLDACPQELCFSILELLVDGLRAWIGDEFQVCTEEEYAADILPLYQTVLVSMQSLAPSTKVLDTLGPVLAAPFCGRKDKHTGAIDAFSEFWQATYAEVPEPPCGYPESITMCFDAVAQAKMEEEQDAMKVEDMTTVHEELEGPTLVSPMLETGQVAVEDEEVMQSDEEGSVVIPSPTRRPASAIFSRESSPVAPLLLVPTTPTTISRNLASPHRPHKSTVKDQLTAVPLDVSSIADASPSRAPTTPKRSPRKNKENQCPLPTIASVTERLAARSPLLLESILGKRPRADDVEDTASLDEKTLKRSRLEASPFAPSVLSNVQVYSVMHDTLRQASIPTVSASNPGSSKACTPDEAYERPSAESEALGVETTPTPISRKRKGVFMDAVEVPSVDHVRASRRPSLDSLKDSSETEAEAESEAEPMEAPKPTIRRTRSATKLLGKDADFQRLETPKRRRRGRAAELREEAAAMSSPLQALCDAPPFGSDDSIMVASPATDILDLPPSDDEPPVGQVTPHRIVSPSLRRVKRLEFNSSSDPPSDDSNMSNSPSRDRVMRKIAWLKKSKHFSSPRSSLRIRARSSVASSSSLLGSDL